MVERDAIIYIPGLFHDPGGSVTTVSRHIAAALDSNSPPTHKFTVSPEKHDEVYGEHTTRTVTISVNDGDQETALIDLYEMSYEQALTDRYERKKPITQVLWIAWAILRNILKIFSAIRRPSKGWRQKLQVAYAGFIALILATSMLLLLITAAATLYDTGAASIPANSETTTQIQQETGLGGATQGAKETPWWLHYAQVAVISLTALGLFTKKDVKHLLSHLTTWFMGTISYLNDGSIRANTVGQLYSLLDHIADKENDSTAYRRKHIIGYSFGSIIAIDAMFPYQMLGERYRDINTLVTIGCPFDFIRTYWPTYFEQRVALDTSPGYWLNIFRSVDVLGSDFLDEAPENPSGFVEQGVHLQGQTSPRRPNSNQCLGPDISLSQVSIADKLALIGFQVHNNYWFDEPYAQDSFDFVVGELYVTSEDTLDLP